LARTLIVLWLAFAPAAYAADASPHWRRSGSPFLRYQLKEANTISPMRRTARAAETIHGLICRIATARILPHSSHVKAAQGRG